MLTNSDFIQAARLLDIQDTNLIKTVASVESAGSGFLKNGLPKILFERHHFSRLTDHQYDHKFPLISSRRSGGYTKNEHARLNLALELDHDAALNSASWGKFQIMGFNHKLAGFKNIDDFVGAMKESEFYQLIAFVNFIKSTGLTNALRDRNWKAFASGYNGPNYAINQYDKKLAIDFTRHTARTNKEIQQKLADAGVYSGAMDGQLGPISHKALHLFQERNRLAFTQGFTLDALGQIFA